MLRSIDWQVVTGVSMDRIAYVFRSSSQKYFMYLEEQRDAVLCSLYLFCCQVTLHVSGVSRTRHQEHTSCSYCTGHEFEDKIQLKRVHGQAATSQWSWPN